jgi:uncharacterized protein YaaR (DUF327 family)
LKISRDKRNLGNFSPLGKTSSLDVQRKESNSFEQELNYRRQADNQMRMQELLEQIEGLYEKLKKTMTIDDLVHYKSLVKKFLTEAINKAYAIQKERGRNRRGRTMLITVGVIDKEVEKIINAFLENKMEPIEIFETMDKIKGMLIDLMV